MTDRLEVNHVNAATGSIFSGQSALVRSHCPHSKALGTRRAGISYAIFCMKSARRPMKSLSMLSGGMWFSVPSAYTVSANAKMSEIAKFELTHP